VITPGFGLSRFLTGSRRVSVGVSQDEFVTAGFIYRRQHRTKTAQARALVPVSLPVSRSEFVDKPASSGRMEVVSIRSPYLIRGENLMKMIKQISAGVLLSAGLLSGGIFSSSAIAAECIAPANPGGGWDFTCRSIGKIMYDIGVVDKPIQVTNMAGGGGGLAYTHVVSERATDEELIVAASSATATRLAQNAYAGMTADQVKFLGAIGADPGVIVVAKDAPYESLTDLLDAVKADPESVTFAGGSAAGGFDHLKVLMALGRADFNDISKVKYIGVDGGADAITQTIGGFTQAMTGDISEVVGFLKSGDVRVLAVLTDERIPGEFDTIPTAKEQGIDVVAVNWRGLYVPKDISDEAYQKWSGALAEVAKSDEWAEQMEANGLAPFTKVGDDFAGYLEGVMAEVKELSKELGVIE